MEKKILYFEEPGPQNTEATIEAARRRASELGIRNIVVATTHGRTGLKVAEAFGPAFNIVAVTICQGYQDEGWTMNPHEREALKAKGVKVFTGLHALGTMSMPPWPKSLVGTPIIPSLPIPSTVSVRG